MARKSKWEAEPIKHLLELTYIQPGRRDFVYTQEYTPKKSFSLSMLEGCTELRVRPYTLEQLTQCVKENYPGGVVNELLVGIRDGTSIAYAGKFWISKQFKDKRIAQYFFKNNEPSGFNFGNFSGPGWPLNAPPFLDEKLIPYFVALKKVRPNVSASLEKCREHLTQAGPEYTTVSDGSLSFKLPKR